MVEFAYNNASHSAIGQSLFFANYSFYPSFVPDFVPESMVSAFQSTVDFLTVTKAQVVNKRAFDKKRRVTLQ